MKDAHLRIILTCYNTFNFDQQLSLYSVINKDDVQIIKIFDDRIDDSTIDCEVTHIDGRPSMEVIKEFTDLLDISRDAGVRFNSALAAVRFNDSDKLVEMPFIMDSFTFRNLEVPNKLSVEYSLICKNNTSTKLTREWKITLVFYNLFENIILLYTVKQDLTCWIIIKKGSHLLLR